MPPKTRKGAKTQFDIDPCAGCSKSTTNGLECDKCGQWYCPNCINSLFPNTITTPLYDMLCTMETFPWICHNCSAIPLGAQLMAAKVADRQSLLQLGVDPKSLGQTFAEGKQDFSPPTSVYSQRSLQPTAIPTTDSVGPSTSTTSTDALLQQLLTQQTQQQLQMQRQMDQQQQHMQQQLAQQQQQMAQRQQMLQALLNNMNLGMVPNPLQHEAAVPAGLMPQSSTPVVTGVVTGGGVQMSDIPAPNIVSGSQPASTPPTTIPVTRFDTTVSGSTTTTSPIVASGQKTLGINPISTPLGQSGYGQFSYTPAGGFGQAPVAAAGLSLAPDSLPMQFNVPLPTIRLTEFYGNFETFDAWWDSFDANVNSRAIPEKLKWDYLQQSVKGKAAKKIEGLRFSASNYSHALRVLKSVYGRSDLLRPIVWASLNALAPVKANLRNLEQFTDAIRSKTITLQRMGVTQDALDEYTTSSLLCKLPSNLMYEIKKMRLLRDAIQPGYSRSRWTLENFLETLVQFQFLAPTPTGGNGKERHRDSFDESQAHEQSSEIPTMANLIQGGQQRTKKSQNRGKKPQAEKGGSTFPTCTYCNDNHYSDRCTTVVTHQERKGIVIAKNCCLRCLSSSHRVRDCKRNKPCYYCGMVAHHCSLCYEATNVEEAQEEESKTPVASMPKVKGKLLQASETSTKEDPKTTSALSPPVNVTKDPITKQIIRGGTQPDGGTQDTTVLENYTEVVDLVPTEVAMFGNANVVGMAEQRTPLDSTWSEPAAMLRQMSNDTSMGVINKDLKLVHTEESVASVKNFTSSIQSTRSDKAEANSTNFSTATERLESQHLQHEQSTRLIQQLRSAMGDCGALDKQPQKENIPRMKSIVKWPPKQLVEDHWSPHQQFFEKSCKLFSDITLNQFGDGIKERKKEMQVLCEKFLCIRSAVMLRRRCNYRYRRKSGLRQSDKYCIPIEQ